jgi:hypothetical protein
MQKCACSRLNQQLVVFLAARYSDYFQLRHPRVPQISPVCARQLAQLLPRRTLGRQVQLSLTRRVRNSFPLPQVFVMQSTPRTRFCHAPQRDATGSAITPSG